MTYPDSNRLPVNQKLLYKSFKYRISTSKMIHAKFEHTLDLCRELYNAGLQERRDAWALNRVRISYFDQQNQLPALKILRSDLNDVYSQVLINSLQRLDKSFKAFFSRIKKGVQAGFPRFKGKHYFDSFCFPQGGFKLLGTKLYLSKIGTVRLRLSRPLVGQMKTCTIKRECDKWYVIFVCEIVPKPLPMTGSHIGIDVGLENFATLSDGTMIENWKYNTSMQKQLRIAQRRVSRRKKGFHRHRRAVMLLKKIHRHIFNQRADFQHKLSTMMINQHDTICVENLNIFGMSKGILSKQIHDVSWSSFFRKLAYKAESAGRSLVKVAPQFTSQDCSQCGNRLKKDLSLRHHNCLKCGLSLHRDHNAALNILRLGLSLKEPTWNTSSCVSLESPSMPVVV